MCLDAAVKSSIESLTLSGIKADILSVTSSEVVARTGVSIGQNEVGNLVITNIRGGRLTKKSAFQYLQEGRVTSILPQKGVFGTRVTIKGSHLLGGGENISVKIGDKHSKILNTPSNELIVVSVNYHVVTEYEKPLQVVLRNEYDSQTVKKVHLWKYTHASITSLDPDNGNEGSVVTIIGRGMLGGGSRITEVRLAGVKATVVSAGETKITLVPGKSSHQSSVIGDVVLENDIGGIVSKANSWT